MKGQSSGKIDSFPKAQDEEEARNRMRHCKKFSDLK